MRLFRRLFSGAPRRPSINFLTRCDVLTSALGYPDPNVRRKAETECQRRVRHRLSLLTNSNAETRRKAAKNLGLLGRGAKSACAPQLTDVAYRDSSPNVRATALTSIIHILADCLKNEGMARDQVSAAQALGNIPDPRATDALIAALEDFNIYVRAAAVNSLGFLRDKRAVDALIKVIRNEAHYHVGNDAAEALKRIGDPVGIDAAVDLGLLAADAESEQLVERAIRLHFDSRRLYGEILNQKDATFVELQQEYEAVWEQLRQRNDPSLARLLVLKSPGNYSDDSAQPAFGTKLGTLGRVAVPALCGVIANTALFDTGHIRVAVIGLREIGDSLAIEQLRRLNTSYSN